MKGSVWEDFLREWAFDITVGLVECPGGIVAQKIMDNASGARVRGLRIDGVAGDECKMSEPTMQRAARTALSSACRGVFRESTAAQH
jgi:hypothetical protein